MAWLTKSKFMAGRQCLKRLWFEVNQPLTEPMAESMPLVNGRKFDLLVQEMEPGTVISRESGMPSAISETRRALHSGAASVLYQPAFKFGDLAAIADILRRKGAGFQLVEVKASTSVKLEHVPDVAFQTLVLRGAKIPVTSVSIGHIDNSFVLRKAGEFEGLKVEEDVTSRVEGLLDEIANEAGQFLRVMNGHEVPDIPMGPQCTAPYACPFIARCSQEAGEGPEYPVDLLPRGAQVAEVLRAEGYEDLRRVPAGRIENEVHRKVHQATVTGVAYRDPVIAESLAGYPFPRAYLDFETLSLSVPEVVGTRPYQQWPFQFSLHIEESQGTVRHVEFLETEAFGDFERLAEALLAALPDTGPVFVYNATLESGVITRLADRYPNLRDKLLGVLPRIVDLLPLTREGYYHRDMKGSWSIKNVLPTIDPTLAYENLGEIAEGDVAQLKYLELRDPQTTAARRRELEAGLKAYCARDTWGLVVLRKFLAGEGME